MLRTTVMPPMIRAGSGILTGARTRGFRAMESSIAPSGLASTHLDLLMWLRFTATASGADSTSAGQDTGLGKWPGREERDKLPRAAAFGAAGIIRASAREPTRESAADS